jgi:hypothetical protein
MKHKKISIFDTEQQINYLEEKLRTRPPCSQGCYSHQSHPCENCGRISGKIPSEKEKILKTQLNSLRKKLLNIRQKMLQRKK